MVNGSSEKPLYGVIHINILFYEIIEYYCLNITIVLKLKGCCYPTRHDNLFNDL